MASFFVKTVFLTLLSPLLILTPFQALAANSNELDVVVKQILTTGTSMPMGNGDELLTLAAITPNDPGIPHKAEYISTVGFRDSSQNYYAQTLTAVSEDWQKAADGNWRIEQWIFNSSLAGELTEIDHSAVIETTDGQYLGSHDLPVGKPQDQAERDRWSRKISDWYGQLSARAKR